MPPSALIEPVPAMISARMEMLPPAPLPLVLAAAAGAAGGGGLTRLFWGREEKADKLLAARRRRVAARRRATAKVAAPDFGPHAPLVRARALPPCCSAERDGPGYSRAVAQARSGVCAGGIYLRVFVWLR